MTDRWEEINRIYDAALELAEEARPGFLENNCRGDEELRREVESLLAYEQQAQQFINRPAIQMTAEKLAGEPPSLAGRQLGPYQILDLLGMGGMGEVYRARDTRLNRTIAIKVLPRHLLERSDLRQRFDREARAIASLDHPHICALYDIGHEGETDFLVMQYLDGETLSQRLKKGPLPTAEVLRHAIQIAGALDQAHRKGVIHRDLKPGNIMLTETGAKLLDFGLAKRQTPVLRTGFTGGEVALRTTSGLATESKSITEAGMILGTLQYMAPEQLEGKEADARTDLFALGVVIYEMATGQKAFEGDSKASLIAKILTFQPPPIGTIQAASPPELDTVVQRCLAKRPEERWQSAAELTSQLEEIAEANLENLKAQKKGKQPSGEAKGIESNTEPAVPVVHSEPHKAFSPLIRPRAWQIGFVGVLLAVITGSLVLWRPRQQPRKAKEISLNPLTSFTSDNPLESVAISPDGKYLAFCSKGKLFIQVVTSREKSSLTLPEGFRPQGASWFSDGTKLLVSRPEERWIQSKYEMILDFSVWSVSILGGTPQKIVDHVTFPSVSPDGSLVAFSRFDPTFETAEIWVVNANGESQRRIRAPSESDRVRYFNPVWSSNGQRLFYRRSDDKNEGIESCTLDGDKVTTVFSSNDYALRWDLCWAPDGRILFPMAEKGLGAEIFNLWEIKVDAMTGKPMSEVRRFTQWSGSGFVNAGSLSITADGKQLALARTNAQADVFVAEIGSGGKTIKNVKNPRRLTLVESDDFVWDWTADSRAVFFESDRYGDRDIFKQDISLIDPETIVAGPENESHPNLSPDGAFILYLVSAKRGELATRLMRIPVGGGPPELVLSGEKIRSFSCAREAKLCVVAEEVEGKQILTQFDPLKGRGEKLPWSDYPNFEWGILSPQGRLIEKMKSGPGGLHIRVRWLTGGPAEEITFKSTGDYQLSGWSLDGKAIYLQEWSKELTYSGSQFSEFSGFVENPYNRKAEKSYRMKGVPSDSNFRMLEVGLDGHSHVQWQWGPGRSIHGLIPSPDGQHLAFTAITYEANAWLLENF